MNPFVVLALTTAALCGLFATLYRWARRIDNYGTVDVAWSYAFALVALTAAATGAGWGPRRLALACVVGAWSVRLGTHLAVRVAGHHPKEDARYGAMRARWAADLPRKMAGFFQLQAVSVVVLAWPFFLIAANRAPQFHALELAGAGLWLVAVGGESIADAQLAAWKKLPPATRGTVCRAGLWGWSRHPNYFFEWLVWVAFFLVACAAPWGWTAVVAPAAMLYLLLRVTGIPLTEELAVKSKGDVYRRYQADVSAFVPWPPRASSAGSRA